MTRRFVLALIVLLAVSAWWAPARPATAQPPTPTPTPPGTPVLPPPNIAGDWSITRTWYRSCPRCGFPVSRTTTWRISQFGVQVDVDKGLRGVVVGVPDTSGLLSLEGVESSGPEVYRFWYSTLRVRSDGRAFEGGFNGSETIMNPCGDDPPMVTCSVSIGYLTARRLGAPPATPTPAGPPAPTGLPSPYPLPSASATPPPTATSPATVTPPATDTATASATPSPTATPRPWWRVYLPALPWE